MDKFEKITRYVEMMEDMSKRVARTRQNITTALRMKKQKSFMWGVTFSQERLEKDLKTYRTQVKGYRALKRRAIDLINSLPELPKVKR